MLLDESGSVTAEQNEEVQRIYKSLSQFKQHFMSYITFSPNEIVYVKGIGYGTLISCGDRNSISQKVENPPQKKESIYFDPDLFNSDADSNNSKKSQSKSEDEKVEKKLVQVIAEKKIEEDLPAERREGSLKKDEDELINIVKVRLEGSQAMVYTSEKNITKSIIVRVKSFLTTRKEQIAVEIQINKTVDTLRKAIFQQLGEQMNNYYNFKLYSTSPTMAELSVPSKTIINCQIKDNAKLILVADYAFSFRPLPEKIHSKYKISLSNNNATLTSAKPAEEPKKAEEKAPAPSQEVKTQEKKDAPAEQKKQQIKKQEQKPKIQRRESQVDEAGAYHSKCSIQFDSGKRYWQIKIEKVPTDEDDILLGVCIQSQTKQLVHCWDCDYLWAYQPVSAKKIAFERDWESNTLTEETQPYGYAVKSSDTIGVLLSFKGKKASVTFYKNSISCGQAFVIDMDKLRSENKALIPFVNIGGQGQVTIDPKALLPLDSYRLR